MPHVYFLNDKEVINILLFEPYVVKIGKGQRRKIYLAIILYAQNLTNTIYPFMEIAF